MLFYRNINIGITGGKNCFNVLYIDEEIYNVWNNKPLTVVYHDELLQPLTPNEVLSGRNICINIMEDTNRNKYQWSNDYIKELGTHHHYKHTRTGADTAFQRGKSKA